MATSAKFTEANSNQLTLFAEGSPARTSALRREPASASSASAQVSGRNLLEYSAKYGLDLHLLKMFPPFEVAGLPWFYKISGRSGLMRSGIAFRLRPLVRLTRETASGSWPTLRACSGKRSSGANRTEMYRRFRTLTARDATPRGASNPEKRREQGHSVSLADQIYYSAKMPTLRATDADRRGRADLIEHFRGNNPKPKHHRVPTLTANRWSGLQSHAENAMLGPLNPEWCEWFMGFPVGWTGLPPSDEQ
jgi:hypothetical protein